MKMTLDRRSILAAAVLAPVLALPAHAQDKTKLRFSAVFSEQDIRAQMMQKFAEAISDQYTLQLYYGGNLFKQGTELVAIQRGNLEMGNIAPPGRGQPGPGLVAAHLGLSVPRRRPLEDLLRQRRRCGDEGDGRASSSASTFSALPISAPGRWG